LGRFDAAREHYMQAASLYPGAQSPYLALSALAARRGDHASARNEMQRVFELPTGLPARDDPWWTYSVFQARNVETLFKRLRELLAMPEP
jgi:hypothetical protein